MFSRRDEMSYGEMHFGRWSSSVRTADGIPFADPRQLVALYLQIRGEVMLRWALIFLVIALAAGLLSADVKFEVTEGDE